jgi:hypothetical protein
MPLSFILLFLSMPFPFTYTLKIPTYPTKVILDTIFCFTISLILLSGSILLQFFAQPRYEFSGGIFVFFFITPHSAYIVDFKYLN